MGTLDEQVAALDWIFLSQLERGSGSDFGAKFPARRKRHDIFHYRYLLLNANDLRIAGSRATLIRIYRRLKLSAITPADRVHASVIKKDFIFTIGVELKRAYSREVHNGRSVDAAKDTRIEVLF